MLLTGIWTGASNDDGKTAKASNLASARYVSDASASSSGRHKIGDDVFIGYWAYRCVSAKWKDAIGSEYTQEYPDANFLVIDLLARNNDRTASVLAPVKLVDEENREYEESSKGIFLENSFGLLKSVNPGVTSSGYIAFDVPPGTYALKVSGGFASGKSELIDLK